MSRSSFVSFLDHLALMWKVSDLGAESSQDGMMFRSCLWLSQWFTFSLLHDFQTQRATVIEVSRAPGAV